LALAHEPSRCFGVTALSRRDKDERRKPKSLFPDAKLGHILVDMSTLSIDVRRAEASDAEAIAAVHDSAWRQAYDGLIPARELGRMITRRGAAWWHRAIRRGTGIVVIDVGGTVVGYATYGPNRARNLVQRGEVYEIYMRPEYQGVGLGTRLFLAARRELLRHGFDSAVVWALAENEGACRFYKNAGGRKIARGSERFGDKVLVKIAFAFARG
jgi:ribosomal protein S18 acetylase RimI-like enzyme